MDNVSNSVEEVRQAAVEFPFDKPYDIQSTYMNHLVHVLENTKIGVFESPTGTGKSLSILCGTLHWLTKENNHIVAPPPPEDELQESTGIAWLDEQHKERSRKAYQVKVQQKLDAVEREKVRLAASIERIQKGSGAKRSRPPRAGIQRKRIRIEQEFSDDSDSDSDEQAEEKVSFRQVIYCSRTHTQLDQFMSEFRRTAYADDVRVVTVVGRRKMCINDSVRALGESRLINERCAELIQTKSNISSAEKQGQSLFVDVYQTEEDIELQDTPTRSAPKTKCPFYGSDARQDLRDLFLQQSYDIEDMVSKGERVGTCPYYASKDAVERAQMIAVPYQLLVNKDARESIGLSLENNVVIVDEAHNLLDTVTNMFSVTLSYLDVR